MSRAIYAGSFDPVTVGHLDVIQRGSALFEHLVVAVGKNDAKRYAFDLHERVRFVREVTADLGNVVVVSFGGLLVHAAKEHDANVILRGVRGLSDFDSEFRYGLANRDLSGIETMFLLSDPSNAFISSSIVKEIVRNGGDVSRYVPAAVLAPLMTRLSGGNP